jgi:hypothetical protein
VASGDRHFGHLLRLELRQRHNTANDHNR